MMISELDAMEYSEPECYKAAAVLISFFFLTINMTTHNFMFGIAMNQIEEIFKVAEILQLDTIVEYVTYGPLRRIRNTLKKVVQKCCCTYGQYGCELTGNRLFQHLDIRTPKRGNTPFKICVLLNSKDHRFSNKQITRVRVFLRKLFITLKKNLSLRPADFFIETECNIYFYKGLLQRLRTRLKNLLYHQALLMEHRT